MDDGKLSTVPFAVEATGLVKRFGDVTAVDGISLRVKEGEIFGFLGPNGAGKTTTINILCTLMNPTEGAASINGFDCERQSDLVRKSIGLVFQESTLDKGLTAYENLSFHAHLYSVPRREIRSRVMEALDFVQLTDRRDDLVKKFSGGMKRRLEVARGLIHRPKVLFLDEPTLGLDPQSRANLWEFVTDLPRRHNVTVFMTTHYMDEAEVCDNIAIIDKGRIIAEGSPAELKQSVGEDIVIIETRDNDTAAFVLKERLGLSTETRGGGLVYLQNEHSPELSQVIKALADTLISIRHQEPTLTDVFLRMTGREVRDEMDGTTGILSDLKHYKQQMRRR